ncbi:hypothetical protein VNO80_22188 [Phaseolus coccineus]|uniref:Uncharacterized protein n=1 Tax=Phaseolus coccineus TaxID=3886 RepID=A0AAN9M572_PHACN
MKLTDSRFDGTAKVVQLLQKRHEDVCDKRREALHLTIRKSRGKEHGSHKGGCGRLRDGEKANSRAKADGRSLRASWVKGFCAGWGRGVMHWGWLREAGSHVIERWSQSDESTIAQKEDL